MSELGEESIFPQSSSSCDESDKVSIRYASSESPNPSVQTARSLGSDFLACTPPKSIKSSARTGACLSPTKNGVYSVFDGISSPDQSEDTDDNIYPEKVAADVKNHCESPPTPARVLPDSSESAKKKRDHLRAVRAVDRLLGTKIGVKLDAEDRGLKSIVKSRSRVLTKAWKN